VTADRSRSIYRPPWRVDLVARAGTASPLPDSSIAIAVARALDAARAPSPGSVAIILTNDDELEELNLEHMAQDGPTDVLSFPLLPPDAFPGPGRRAERVPDPGRSRRTHIGDIAISMERAIDQAESGRGGHTGDVRCSAADELRLLVTHGTLHLCGWDHAEPDEASAMRSLERSLIGGDR
jgi:probable rRNA maturation factor